MSNWDTIGQIINKKSSGSSDYVKLIDGQSIICVFLGEPLVMYKIYKDPVEYQNYVQGSAFRFKLNVALLENDKFSLKLMENSKTLLKSIHACIKRYGQNYLYEISREGKERTDTMYHVMPVGPLSPEQQAEVNKIKPYELYLSDGKPRNRDAQPVAKIEPVKQEVVVQKPVVNVDSDINDYLDEEDAKPLKTRIVDKVIELIGTSARDIEDFTEMFTEWRDSSGKLRAMGIKDLTQLNYQVKEGKQYSQAQVFFNKIRALNKAEATRALQERRAGK